MEFKILCKGDLHQGSNIFPLLSRGKQCVSICLIFLLKTLTLDVYDWTKQDLYDVMKHGDELYRKIQKETLSPNEYLHPSELPEKVMFEDHNFYYEFRVRCCKLLVVYLADNLWGICQFFLLKMPYSYSGSCFAYYILVVQGSAIGIFYNGQKFLVFDSQARDENGRSCSDGSCILG